MTMNEPNHGNSEEEKHSSAETSPDQETKEETPQIEMNKDNNQSDKEGNKKLSPMPKGNKDMKLKDFRKRCQ